MVSIPIAKTINLTRVDVKNAFQYSTQIFISLLIRAFEKQTKKYLRMLHLVFRHLQDVYCNIFRCISDSVNTSPKEKGHVSKAATKCLVTEFTPQWHDGEPRAEFSERTTPWSLVPSFL